MLSLGPVRTDFDFDSPGKRGGFIDVAFSDNVHAFSAIRLPVGVICGGEGPTVLLTGGNHGDEYEGQVILHWLMQHLTPDNVAGRIIMLPALNQPAVRARSRVSPLDDGNINRSFPGDPEGGPTQAIAAFVATHLISKADLIVDFHSGGTATEYVDCGFLCLGPDADLNTANLELAEIFGTPFTMVCPIDGFGGDFDTAAHQQKTRFMSCELGGMGRFSTASFKIGWQGIRRILTREGLLAEAIAESGETRFIDVGAKSRHCTSAHHALSQLHVRLGDEVAKGDSIATLFDIHNFGEVRDELRSEVDGVVAVCRRNPLVDPGDHICMICPEIPRQKLL